MIMAIIIMSIKVVMKVKIIMTMTNGGMAEWLRRRVSNHARSTNHRPTVNSAVHPSEVGK